MDKELQIFVRNSELTIAKEKRAFLTYPAEGLADCSLEELEDGISLYFQTEELEASDEVFSKSREQQLRFLVNCAELERLYDEYSFSLSTDNLMVDINLRPKALLRSVGNGNKQEFLQRYKALIGCFLLRKYKYEDFEQGGYDLFKKNKLMLELSEMESSTEIKERLLQEYRKTVNENLMNCCLVSKRNMLISRIAIPVLVLSLLVTSFFMGRALFFDIPYRNYVIAANEAYIAGNHLEVQRALVSIPVHNLTHETKNILARSYVATEPISSAQRENILMGLTLITDTSIFDYWIHLGRLQFYEAIDIAQRFGDTELLLFAYLRQEAIVRADPHMPGSEKVELLAYLEGRIAALQRDRAEAERLAGTED